MRGSIVTLKRAKRLRREMTLPEVVLWRELRRKQLSKHFRRQHPAGPYVLDFYCSAAKLAVEVTEQHMTSSRRLCMTSAETRG